MSEPKNNEHNPCLQEQKLSLKCLQDYFGNKSKCEPQIENYNDCKTFWYNIYVDRKKTNIKPYMPSLEERIRIKKEYFSNQQNK